MLDNLTGSNLQPAVVGAIIASGTALVVSLLTWLSTSRQVRVSRDTLFVSLLPRRHEWLDNFNAAVANRKSYLEKNQYDSSFYLKDEVETSRIIIHSSGLSANWLFSSAVAEKVIEIERAFDEYVRIKHRPLNNKADYMNEFDDRRSNENARVLLVDDIVVLCVPYLYVGDVKRRDSLPTRLRSAAKRFAETIRVRFAQKTPPTN